MHRSIFLKSTWSAIVLLGLIGMTPLCPAADIVSTLTLQNFDGGYISAEDTLLLGTAANYGGLTHIAVGGLSGQSGFASSLIRFPGFYGGWGVYALPTYSVIRKATLRLYSYDAVANTSVRVYRMDQSWSVGAGTGDVIPGKSCMAYRNYRTDGAYTAHPSSTWGHDGIMHDGPVIGYDADPAFVKGTAQGVGWVEFDVTAMVRKWYSDFVHNYSSTIQWGFYLVSDRGVTMSFHSCDYEDNPALRPMLVIDYTYADDPNPNVVPSAIVLPTTHTHADVEAAVLLQDYLERIQGTTTRISYRDDSPANAVIIGDHPGNAAVKTLLQTTYPTTGADWVTVGRNREAIAVTADGTNVHLLGNCPQATIWAARAWLEHLGVRWLFPHPQGIFIPTDSVIIDPSLSIMESPSMALRGNCGYGGSVGYSASEAHRSSCVVVGPTYGPLASDRYVRLSYGHDGYTHFLNKSVYFAAHPDWYAMVNGVRGGEPWQVCFTSEPAAQQYAANAIAELQQELLKGTPIERIQIGLSPRDAPIDCQCPTCQAILSAGGNDTDLVIHFANRVASIVKASYPDARFMVMAYYEHFAPPAVETPDSNLIIEIARYNTVPNIDHSKPMLDPVNSAEFCATYNDYRSAGVGLACYTYYGHYLVMTPWPVLTQMSYDFPRFAAESTWIGSINEAHGHWGTQGPNLYLLGKLMWNAGQDVSALMADYYAKGYGPAGPYVQAYFQAMQAAVDTSTDDLWGYLWEMPEIFTPSLIDTCDGLIAQARGQLPVCDVDTAWRVSLVCDAWNTSKSILEAMARYVTATPQSSDLDYMVPHLQEAWDYAQTDNGRMAFEYNVCNSILNSRYRQPLAMPLAALPVGTHNYTDKCYYGGATKFHAAQVSGYFYDYWATMLSPGQTGTMDIPIAAAAGGRLTAGQIKIACAGGSGDVLTHCVSVIDASDVEHVLGTDYTTVSNWMTVPAAALADGFTLRIRQINPTANTYAYAIGSVNMTFTVAAKTVPEDCPDVIAMGYALGGDINGDCVVDMTDFTMIATEWLTEADNGDLNHDSQVNLNDFRILQAAWNQCNMPGNANCVVNW